MSKITGRIEPLKWPYEQFVESRVSHSSHSSHCPRCGGQCLPSDDVCVDWQSRALAAEAEVAQLKERLRISEIGTHAEGCWEWGPRHYECARAEVERLRAGLKDAIQSLEDWVEYAPQWAKEKHGLNNELARVKGYLK